MIVLVESESEKKQKKKNLKIEKGLFSRGGGKNRNSREEEVGKRAKRENEWICKEGEGRFGVR